LARHAAPARAPVESSRVARVTSSAPRSNERLGPVAEEALRCGDAASARTRMIVRNRAKPAWLSKLTAPRMSGALCAVGTWPGSRRSWKPGAERRRWPSTARRRHGVGLRQGTARRAPRRRWRRGHQARQGRVLAGVGSVVVFATAGAAGAGVVPAPGAARGVAGRRVSGGFDRRHRRIRAAERGAQAQSADGMASATSVSGAGCLRVAGDVIARAGAVDRGVEVARLGLMTAFRWRRPYCSRAPPRG
jgi:hypothetical protein